MKLIIFLVSFCFATSILAKTWTCPVRGGTQPNERIIVDFDKTLNSITYVQQIPNEDGRFIEKSESLFSQKDQIRGALFSYCELDNGHIAEEYKMINWTSRCSTKDTQMPLFFAAKLHQDQFGYVQVQILELPSGNDTQRVIRTDICK